MDPEMVRYPKPFSSSLTLSHSMVLTNWLNTSALAEGSCALITCSCTTKTCLLIRIISMFTRASS